MNTTYKVGEQIAWTTIYDGKVSRVIGTIQVITPASGIGDNDSLIVLGRTSNGITVKDRLYADDKSIERIQSMSNTTYKAGDRVVVTSNVANEVYAWHCFNIGDVCTVDKVGAKDFYLIKDASGIEHWLHSADFRPAESSYSLQEYRDRLPVSDAMNDSDPSDHINF